MSSSASWADEAVTKISCDYAFMTVPFANVEIVMQPDGSLSSSALITPHQGKPHKESLTEEIKAGNELMHGWISKESTDNSIEMIIYKDKQADGQSKLINPHVPIGQEMWGNCTGIPGT